MTSHFAALPQPPAIEGNAVWPFTIFYLTIAALATMLALVWCLRNRSALPFAFLGGGLIVSLAEALLDHVTLLYWPANLPLTAYTLVERPVPFALVVGYGVYCGIAAWIVSRWFESGMSRRNLIGCAAALYAFDLLFEIPWLIAGTYVYYGNQPLKFGPLPPLHWPLMNVTLVFVTAWLFLLLKRASPRHAVAAGFMSPLLSIGAIFTVGWPVFSALNSAAPPSVVFLSAVATIALSLSIIAMIIRYIEMTYGNKELATNVTPAPRHTAGMR